MDLQLAEACMLVGGVIKEGLRDGHLQFDVESWVCTHILPSITKDGRWMCLKKRY